METPEKVILISVGIVLVGSLLQTSKLFPSFFDSVFDKAAGTITISTILLFVSVLVLLFFLKALTRWNREGFEDQEPKAMTKWKELTATYPIQDICAMKEEIDQKLFALEKGLPPNELSDQQARERVDKIFTANTSNGTVNCQQFKTVSEAKDIDSFFTAIQEVPNTFLIQVQDTADRILFLAQKQMGEVVKAEEEAKKAKEGFIDPSVGICSPEVTEERRKFLRQKKLDEAAERCLLPEEVPLEKKDDVALDKVNKIQSTYDSYIRMSLTSTKMKPLVSDTVERAKSILAGLKEKQKKAEAGQLL